MLMADVEDIIFSGPSQVAASLVLWLHCNGYAEGYDARGHQRMYLDSRGAGHDAKPKAKPLRA